MPDQPSAKPTRSEFERASEAAPSSFVGEFIAFLRYNKKWWLAPIIVVVLLVGLIIVAGSGPAATLIYTLF